MQCRCIERLKHIRSVWESLLLVLLNIVGVARMEMCVGQHPGGLKLPSKKPQLNGSAQVLEIVESKLKLAKSAWLATARLG